MVSSRTSAKPKQSGTSSDKFHQVIRVDIYV